jgi:hypothetical protein
MMTAAEDLPRRVILGKSKIASETEIFFGELKLGRMFR